MITWKVEIPWSTIERWFEEGWLRPNTKQVEDLRRLVDEDILRKHGIVHVNEPFDGFYDLKTGWLLTRELVEDDVYGDPFNLKETAMPRPKKSEARTRRARGSTQNVGASGAGTGAAAGSGAGGSLLGDASSEVNTLRRPEGLGLMPMRELTKAEAEAKLREFAKDHPEVQAWISRVAQQQRPHVVRTTREVQYSDGRIETETTTSPTPSTNW